jgi:hypothetical protein
VLKKNEITKKEAKLGGKNEHRKEWKEKWEQKMKGLDEKCVIEQRSEVKRKIKGSYF